MEEYFITYIKDKYKNEDVYRLTGIYFDNIPETVNKTNIIKINKQTFTELMVGKKDTKMIFIDPEAIKNKQVLFKDFIFIREKFENLSEEEIQKIKEFNKYKIKKIAYLETLFGLNLNKLSIFSLIDYYNIFNYFASKGIFITAENKEDKYIEILELDDETAIEKLEHYLNLQEFVEKNNAALQSLIENIEDLNYAESFEEVDDIFKNILNEVFYLDPNEINLLNINSN